MYIPGTRPDDGKWKKVSCFAREGDSFYDGKYGDLGIVITNPLEIYENDSEDVKAAMHKFCKLANKIQAAQEMIEVRIRDVCLSVYTANILIGGLDGLLRGW